MRRERAAAATKGGVWQPLQGTCKDRGRCRVHRHVGRGQAERALETSLLCGPRDPGLGTEVRGDPPEAEDALETSSATTPCAPAPMTGRCNEESAADAGQQSHVPQRPCQGAERERGEDGDHGEGCRDQPHLDRGQPQFEGPVGESEPPGVDRCLSEEREQSRAVRECRRRAGYPAIPRAALSSRAARSETAGLGLVRASTSSDRFCGRTAAPTMLMSAVSTR